MDILFLLLPLSFVLVIVVVALVIWAVQNGQFDDLNSPAYRILNDDGQTTDPKRGKITPEEPEEPEQKSLSQAAGIRL